MRDGLDRVVRKITELHQEYPNWDANRLVAEALLAISQEVHFDGDRASTSVWTEDMSLLSDRELAEYFDVSTSTVSRARREARCV